MKSIETIERLLEFSNKKLYKIYCEHPEITTDSRICPKNSIFFALKGDNFNGNKFALSALEKGCSFAVVDEAEFAIDSRFILVENVLETLQKLAEHHRRQLQIPVIGITGTNGKTTTKELVAAVLSKKFNVLYTQGNFNNHIGVPLTLLKINAKHNIAIVEMGANHCGEIAFLTNIARPNFGLITNVGKAHLEGFGSLQGVLATKGELYDFLRNNGGTIFRNENIDCLKSISQNLDTITYGVEAETAFVSGKIVDETPFVTLQWHENDTTVHTVKTHFVGSYNAANMLAAVAVGLHFGVTPADIDLALSEYQPQNNRSQLIEKGDNTLIVDAYNANPTSMEAALTSFKKMNFAKKAVILGDMLELGAQSDEEHQKVVDILEKANFDTVFLVGKCFEKTKNHFQCFENVSELTAFLTQNPPKNSAILIKGSHGIGLQKLVEHIN